MSFIDKLNEIEIAKNNIKASLESKGKQPGNDIREYSAIINSLNGDIPSSTKVKVIIQELEPEDTAYQGFWIKSNDYTYNEIHIISNRDEVFSNSINIVKSTRKNRYKTILLDSDVFGGLYWEFNEILITDNDNNILWNIPIYYGNDLGWIDITPSDIHWAGVSVDYTTDTFTRIEGSDNIDDIRCYYGRVRCNIDNEGNVVARYGDSNYDNNGNENLQVMVEQPIVYIKVANVELDTDGTTILKADYYIADGQLDEDYQVHRAFIVNDDIYKNIYLNAYEGTVINQKLSSYNTKAAPTVSISRTTARNYALNRGSIWRQWTYLAHNLETLLMLVEYCTFDWENTLAKGRYSGKNPVGQVEMNKFDINGTGFQNGDKTANLSFTYRYRENPYGNYGILLEGYERDTANIYISNTDFNDNISVSSTKMAYAEHCNYAGGGGNYYITRIDYISDIPYLFEPKNGSRSTPMYGSIPIGSNDKYYRTLQSYSGHTTMLFYDSSNYSSSSFTDTCACLMCYPPDQIIEN